MKGWLIDRFPFVLPAILVFLFIYALYLGGREEKRRRELVLQCRDSGRLEFECEAMFQKQRNSYPVFYPTGR